MKGSQSFSVGRRTFDQPKVRYWEDMECPICAKITEHRRTERWDLVCTECGEHFVPDPLKRFQSKEEKQKLKEKYLLPKIRKQYEELVNELKQWFINFEDLDKDAYLNSFGKTKSITFMDFDNKKKTCNLDLKRLDIAKQQQIALFYTKLCDMGQTDADIWWRKHFEIKEWLNLYPNNEEGEKNI